MSVVSIRIAMLVLVLEGTFFFPDACTLCDFDHDGRMVQHLRKTKIGQKDHCEPLHD
jgi:hypothetical protein